MSVKINELQIENVKRIKAVKLEPTANGLTVIGGKNNQGKTSVLDSIAWALGGDRFKPSQPNREGSVTQPYLKVTLSNGVIVERTGKNSSLKVIDPNGNKGGQQLLNEFIEAFALNLPKFLQSTANEKANILLQIIGVGDKLIELETIEKEKYNKRHAIGQIAEQKKKYADEMIHYDNVPLEPVSASDWAEKLCSQAVCARANKSGIEDFGYGKGYTYLKEEFGKLLNILDEVINQGIHVVFTAHSYLKKFEQPDEMGAYDRYEMKLTKYVAPLVKEWADTVLFANYKTYVVSDEKGNKKAQGGTRMMFTTHNPCWDAKNRDGLADELPFDFEQIRHILTYDSSQDTAKPDRIVQKINEITDNDELEVFDTKEDVKTDASQSAGQLHSSNPVIQQLFDLMNANQITVEELQDVVADNGYFPKETPIEAYGEDFISGCLIAAWSQVLAKIKEYKKLPF